MDTLGQRLNYLLKKKNIKARTLAKGIGLPETTISNILHDKFEPGVYKIKKIAEYLNADLHWLITGVVNYNYPVSPESGESTMDDPDDAETPLIFAEEFMKEVRQLDPEYQRVILSILKSINQLTRSLK